jgi:hypothetical protein
MNRVVIGLALLAVVTSPARAQVTVGGLVYVQYQYNLAGDSLKADSAIQHINNFDVTRAYINVTGRFDGGIAARLTGDIFTNTNIPGSRAYRIKYAYVAWTPEGSALTYKIGEMNNPFLDFEDALWDYRMQGPLPLDRAGYLSSSDFGLGVDGRFNADQFNFQAGLFNGETYSGALGDNRKDVEARATFRVLKSDDPSRLGGLRLTGYAHVGAPSSGGQRNRFVGLVSYHSTAVTLGAEYAATKDSTTGGNTTVGGGAVAAKGQLDGRVIAAYGVVRIPRTRLSVIGRVDVVDPNTKATGDRTTRLIAGLAYQLTPSVRLLADLDDVSYEKGFVPTATTYAAYVARSQGLFQVMFSF